MIHGYIRVSTEGQAREDRSSLDDQERRIRAIASLRDDPRSLAPPDEPTIWRDAGVSGALALARRPAGAALLAALSPGDVVVAAKLDRLFRNAEDALAQSRSWRERSVDLILADMGTESVTTSSTGRLYFGMLAQFAEFERERIAERIRDGRTAKRARGGFVGGRPPTGFEIYGAGRTAMLVSNDREQSMIELAQWLANDDNSPTRIAETLNSIGFRSRAGTPLHAAQIWRWLRRTQSGAV